MIEDTFERMWAHTRHHNIKEWLLEGCRQEDARTIKNALHRTSRYKLAFGLAKLLTEDE
jgi:hypothetical protein